MCLGGWSFLPGNRKVNLELVNAHFNEEKKIFFLSVNNEKFKNLYSLIKDFSKEIRTYYEHEEDLINNFNEFRLILNRFFNTIEPYEIVFDNYLQYIFKLFSEIKIGYPNLYEIYGEPILKIIKKIYEENKEINFIIDALEKKYYDSIELTLNTYIITRFKPTTEVITINDTHLKVYKASEFIKLNIFADNLIFIGSPSTFDEKFSSLFFSKNTYFITYDIFDNRITRRKNFKILKQKDTINNIYSGVHIARGFKGGNFTNDLGIIEKEFDSNKIIKKFKEQSESLHELDKVEAKLVVLPNKCYTFVPIHSKLRVLDKDTLDLNLIELDNLEIGDWVLFRNNSNTDLIIDVANNILGDSAEKHRSRQKHWKNRLKKLVLKYGMTKVIAYLREKGIETANAQNIRNWLSEESIGTNNHEMLLEALKYSKNEIRNIMNSTEIIRSAHLRAGKEVSKQILEEIKPDIIDEIEENGYATFSSELFHGASFNIEVIQGIDKDTLFIDQSKILKIWGK